ncbi:hypothetical protein BDR26DRAFT_903590 [Obelidium mucronatum]|nr:hypothetical protein BDR26DRAFT_903590 [Obelidium mucronatum]
MSGSLLKFLRTTSKGGGSLSGTTRATAEQSAHATKPCGYTGCNVVVLSFHGFCKSHAAPRVCNQCIDLCETCFRKVPHVTPQPTSKLPNFQKPLPKRHAAAPSSGPIHASNYNYTFAVTILVKAIKGALDYRITTHIPGQCLTYNCSSKTTQKELMQEILKLEKVTGSIADIHMYHPTATYQVYVMKAKATSTATPGLCLQENETVLSGGWDHWKPKKSAVMLKKENQLFVKIELQFSKTPKSRESSFSSIKSQSTSESVVSIPRKQALTPQPTKRTSRRSGGAADVIHIESSESEEEPLRKRVQGARLQSRSDSDSLFKSVTTVGLSRIGPTIAIAAVGGMSMTSVQACTATPRGGENVSLSGSVFAMIWTDKCQFQKYSIGAHTIHVKKEEIGRGTFRKVSNVVWGNFTGGSKASLIALPDPTRLVFKNFLSEKDKTGNASRDSCIEMMKTVDPEKFSRASLQQQAFTFYNMRDWTNSAPVGRILRMSEISVSVIPAYGFNVDGEAAKIVGTHCFLESRLDGAFIKFFNNDGMEKRVKFNEDRDLLDIFDVLSAFSHHVYRRYKEKMLITDLQGGVVGRDIKLTDTAVICDEVENPGNLYFGPGNYTDALKNFKKTHICQTVCQQLKYDLPE